MTDHHVTHTAVVPAVAGRWPEHATEPVASLRVLQVGGARLADEIARTVRPVLGATLQRLTQDQVFERHDQARQPAY